MAKNLKAALVRLAKTACGGSHQTKEARVNTVKAFADHLQQAGYGNLRDPAQIRTTHIASYAVSQAGQVTARTMANKLSHIRAVVAATGKGTMLKESALSNKALGAAGGSRTGTKTAMPDTAYTHFHTAVSAKSVAAGHVMELQRALGLRINEAVRGANAGTLQQWQKQLQQGYARITVGTKGGRPRETLVAAHERALAAVTTALAAATANGGNVIPAATGKQAYDQVRNAYAAAGMVGKHASHSLRYAWAREQLAAYQAQGMSERQARQELSQDLGHGDGRGRYVAMVYCRKNG